MTISKMKINTSGIDKSVISNGDMTIMNLGKDTELWNSALKSKGELKEAIISISSNLYKRRI